LEYIFPFHAYGSTEDSNGDEALLEERVTENEIFDEVRQMIVKRIQGTHK
jgi:hypothetical protein